MKKSKILACAAFFTLCFAANASTTEVKESVSGSVDFVQGGAAGQSANVRFANQLQKELNANNLKGAIALFEKMPASLQNDTGLKNLLGALYYSDGQYDKAISSAEAVLLIDGKNVEALELISIAAHAKGDRKTYQETAKRILEVDPYNPSVNIQQGQDYAVAKKYKQARTSYAKALKGDSKNEDALFGFAQMCYYLDDMQTAKSSFERLLNQNPESAIAYSYLGKLSAEDQNYLKAESLVKKAIALEPSNYDFYMDLGSYLRSQGKYDAATTAWKKAASLDPTYFLAYAYLAGVYDERDMFDQALENYHKVIQTNPKYFYAYEETAILEYHAGNYQAAIKYFEKAYEYSQSLSYKLMIAACYYKLKKPLDAKNVLNPVLKTLDRESLEYMMARFWVDNFNRNAEAALVQRINKEENSQKKGKMQFYMGLFYEIMGGEDGAVEMYSKVAAMQAPMFFEFRIAEWGMKAGLEAQKEKQANAQ